MTYRMYIPPTKVNEVREWFATRQGCCVWTNKEIGNSRPDIMTPILGPDGQHTKAPHWAYVGEPSPILPSEIGVRTETHVPMPLDWFPVCESCKGTGRRSLSELAAIRGETVDKILSLVDLTSFLGKIDLESDTCNCSWCQGTGHVERHVLVAIRKRYWGLDISETGKTRARRLARKLGQDVKWDWSYDRPGYAGLTFYRETIEPFTL